MKEFDVTTPLEGKWLIEASAGTGKTYTIEQLFLRLIVDEKIPIGSILIVTFTRAATRDLKSRLYHRLKTALKEDSENQCIEDALALFHDAPIYTIHAFCLRMLTKYLFSSGMTLSKLHESGMDDFKKQEVLLKKFLWEQLPRHEVVPVQIHHLLNTYAQDEKSLFTEIIRMVSAPYDISLQPSFEAEYILFMKRIETFFDKVGSLCEGFCCLPLYYKGMCSKDGNVKRALHAQFQYFIDCLRVRHFSVQNFEILLRERGEFLSYFLPENLKKKPSPKEEDLPYIELFGMLRAAVYPIIERATHPLSILLKIAALFKPVWEKFIEAQEILHPDRILQLMCQNLIKPEFVEGVQSEYSAVLIDEFQDTDQLQWSIFYTLFMEAPESKVFLVGDPKQSIYAFRNADIYTYICARDHIPPEHYVRLGVCYRADPPLTEALNALFSVPNLFPLPRQGTALEYWAVASPAGQQTHDFKDSRGAVHFFHANAKKGRGSQWPSSDIEEQFFFPFIAQEIATLYRQGQFTFKDFAVLVRDRYQARRIQEHLRSWNIPAVSLRAHNLRESPIAAALTNLLWAVLFPDDSNRVAIALAGVLIGWSEVQLINLAMKQEKQKLFAQLREEWCERGFAMMMRAFFIQDWGNGTCNAKLEYRELLVLVDFLIEWELEHTPVPEELIHFLEEWRLGNYEDDTKALLSEEDAVSLLTMHMSKGLEFPVVFALGVIHRDRRLPELFCKVDGGKRILTVAEEGEDFKAHLEEVDAEKMRQLYVSLTRAKHRVYIPVLFETGGEEKSSPMELFLSKWGGDLECLIKYPHTTAEACQENPACIPIVMPQRQSADNCTTYPVTYPSIPLVSFSTLTHTKVLAVPFEGPSPELPSSSETGVLLHDLLEHVPLECFHKGYASLLKFVQARLDRNPYVQHFTDIVWKTFTTPLQLGEHAFCLKDIPQNAWRKECEFLYISEEKKYISGVMDAIIQYGDTLYLIDWKSNYLGPHFSNYATEDLERAMEAHSYTLQASLYEEAITRSLGDLSFGGTAYIFLRGVHYEEGVQYGVWFKRSHNMIVASPGEVLSQQPLK